MTLSSVSSGRYIIGVTCWWPVLRPRWVTRTIGAPSKGPPTRPSLARNSLMVFVFQSVASGTARSSLLAQSGLMDGWWPDSAKFENLEAERFELRQNPVHRGRVLERGREHRLAAAHLGLHGGERGQRGSSEPPSY